MGTLPTHLSGSWTWSAEYMVIIAQPRAITESTVLYSRYMQLESTSLVGVNSRIPGVHAAAGGSLTLLCCGLVNWLV